MNGAERQHFLSESISQQIVGVAVAGALWVGRQDVYTPGLPPETALALGFRDDFWGLTLVGLLATVVSGLRGPVPSRSR
ncbi:MAG: hypothetical protein ACE5JP_15150 [Candidatus Bipolaricaulia bacterium]